MTTLDSWDSEKKSLFVCCIWLNNMEKWKQIQEIIKQYLLPLHKYSVRQQCETSSYFSGTCAVGALAHIFGLQVDVCREFVLTLMDKHMSRRADMWVRKVLIGLGVTPLSHKKHSMLWNKIRPRK